jgi:Flp pilus assembly pilin Flp
MHSTPATKTTHGRSRFFASRRGAVLVEYAFLLVAVGIPTMVGITAGGAKMYANYARQRALIMQNTP